MTGPEHYKTAEAALERATDAIIGSHEETYHLARAQVHATLALAAATAADGEHQDWSGVFKHDPSADE
jgi:hypothetical protein